MKWRKAILIAGVLVVIALGIFFWLIPGQVAHRMNGVLPTDGDHGVRSPTSISLPATLTVDLHADTLLWARDPARRASYGHIDLPRMLEAGHGLQVFSAVTQVPRGLNFERNEATPDLVTLLAVAQRWPIRTWNNRLERALYQSDRLHRLDRQTAGAFMLITGRDDLNRFLQRRQRGESVVAGILAIEGMQAIASDIDNVDRLHRAGYRIMGLTHFFDNAVGGSAHGVSQGGLTPFGAAVVGRMEQLDIIVDLAHAAPQLIADVLAIARRPVLVTHTGVRGTCDNERNLSDAQLEAITRGGGLIGIAFFEHAVCGTGADAIVRAIRYTIDRVGVDAVALGSDFDGGVTLPFDVTGLGRLEAALAADGLAAPDIAKVMGGNALRFLSQHLPAGRQTPRDEPTARRTSSPEMGRPSMPR